jgi:hypothetical protein
LNVLEKLFINIVCPDSAGLTHTLSRGLANWFIAHLKLPVLVSGYVLITVYRTACAMPADSMAAAVMNIFSVVFMEYV